MPTVVVSDVHLGCAYCRCDPFLRFLRSLPAGVDLVLNGDTANTYDSTHYPPKHQEALEAIRAESLRRRVVWIRGNHDERYAMADPGRIEFVPSHHIGQTVFLAHGHDFDNLIPRNRTVVLIFRTIHRLRASMGAESVHMAHYAKRFPLLYRILLRHVAMNAVEHAKENGYLAVACGHTHYAEDRMHEGIRYLNTGSWTEGDACYLAIEDGTIELRQVPGP